MVKIYVVPLESFQSNLLQQVLRKLPVKSLCRLRMTCKYFNSHIEEHKNTFASRVFDRELDLLWSYSLSCPNLAFYDIYEFQPIDRITCNWGKYPENVTWDSNLNGTIDWTPSYIHFDESAAEKLSGIAFGVVGLSDFSEDMKTAQFMQINTLKSLNLHCELLGMTNIPLADLHSFAEAIKCRSIHVAIENIEGENEDWEEYVSQLATSELCPKIHLNLTLAADGAADQEWVKKFRGLSVAGKDRDFKKFLQELYTTTEKYTLKYIQFDITWEADEEPNLSLEIPHETLWERESLPMRYRKPFTPRFIHLVQLSEELAVVSVYEHQTKKVIVNIVEQDHVLNVIRKELHMWDSRRDEEYLSAGLNRRKEILREQFLASRR